jgi:hypothetical protein
VSGLSTRLVEVTAWRRGLRLLRFVAVTSVIPIALLVGGFLLLWWSLSHSTVPHHPGRTGFFRALLFPSAGPHKKSNVTSSNSTSIDPVLSRPDA